MQLSINIGKYGIQKIKLISRLKIIFWQSFLKRQLEKLWEETKYDSSSRSKRNKIICNNC
jgi:hypothetical protein